VLLEEDDASAQREYTIPLEPFESDPLAGVSGKRVQKNRYPVVIDGHPAEVDVFCGRLKGLVMLGHPHFVSLQVRIFRLYRPVEARYRKASKHVGSPALYLHHLCETLIKCIGLYNIGLESF
jgi:hypothetical protein